MQFSSYMPNYNVWIKLEIKFNRNICLIYDLRLYYDCAISKYHWKIQISIIGIENDLNIDVTMNAMLYKQLQLLKHCFLFSFLPEDLQRCSVKKSEVEAKDVRTSGEFWSTAISCQNVQNSNSNDELIYAFSAIACIFCVQDLDTHFLWTLIFFYLSLVRLSTCTTAGQTSSAQAYHCVGYVHKCVHEQGEIRLSIEKG